MVMKLVKYAYLSLLVSMLAACATPARKAQPGLVHGDHVKLLDVLPDNIEGFLYQDSTTYPDPWGYSLRYAYSENSRVYSDIYIYPVPKEMREYSQEEIVNGMTNAALREIELVKQRGAYSEFQIIEADASHMLGEYLTRVEMYLVKNNLASYSLLFLTERDGRLIKVRMTMPDNESNRKSATWQKFINTILSGILKNIEKA